MTVRFLIPGALTAMTDGLSAVEVKTSADTLRDALQALFASYPGLRDRVATEQGELRPHVNVFVGKEESRFTGGLATPLTDGADISIIPAISGGCVFQLTLDQHVAPLCSALGASFWSRAQVVAATRALARCQDTPTPQGPKSVYLPHNENK